MKILTLDQVKQKFDEFTLHEFMTILHTTDFTHGELCELYSFNMSRPNHLIANREKIDLIEKMYFAEVVKVDEVDEEIDTEIESDDWTLIEKVGPVEEFSESPESFENLFLLEEESEEESEEEQEACGRMTDYELFRKYYPSYGCRQKYIYHRNKSIQICDLTRLMVGGHLVTMYCELREQNTQVSRQYVGVEFEHDDVKIWTILENGKHKWYKSSLELYTLYLEKVVKSLQKANGKLENRLKSFKRQRS